MSKKCKCGHSHEAMGKFISRNFPSFAVSVELKFNLLVMGAEDEKKAIEFAKKSFKAETGIILKRREIVKVKRL